MEEDQQDREEGQRRRRVSYRGSQARRRVIRVR